MRPIGRLFIAAVMLVVIAGSGSSAEGTGAERDYTDPGQLATLVAGREEPYILVDVRTAREYLAGHIPTAVNIPYDTIAANPPTPDKAALIIVYCGSGVRSAKAAAALAGIGYSRVVDFGAVSRWEGDLAESAPEAPLTPSPGLP